jgi:hypothetical protein
MAFFAKRNKRLIQRSGRDEVSKRAMPGTPDLADILEFVIDSFYDRTFSQRDFIAHVHRAILHVVTDAGDQMYIVDNRILVILKQVNGIFEWLINALPNIAFTISRWPIGIEMISLKTW